MNGTHCAGGQYKLMHQPDHVIPRDIPLSNTGDLPPVLPKYVAIRQDIIGLIPNVLAAYGHDAEQGRTFSRFYNALMFSGSALSNLGKDICDIAGRCTATNPVASAVELHSNKENHGMHR